MKTLEELAAMRTEVRDEIVRLTREDADRVSRDEEILNFEEVRRLYYRMDVIESAANKIRRLEAAQTANS
ncbi:hypothetical protein I6F15_11690 [Bradyrhizobium sp. BRP14]|nr:hypothetical protein [Bradyrhizobium sp. BRP14]